MRVTICRVTATTPRDGTYTCVVSFSHFDCAGLKLYARITHPPYLCGNQVLIDNIVWWLLVMFGGSFFVLMAGIEAPYGKLQNGNS